MPSATPQIILGDQNTGVGSDNLRQCLGKYNTHVHTFANSTLPLLAGVRPGDSIQSVADCNPPAFPNGASVLSLNRNGLVASTNALRSIDCNLQVGNKTVYFARVTQGSAVVSFLSNDGFVVGGNLAGYASKPVSLLIPAAQTLTYPVLREIPWGGILDRMVVQTLNGTATIRFLINSAMVATSPLNTTPIVVDFQSTSNNPTYFNAGDDLFLQVTAAGSNPTIHLSLYLLSLSG